MKDLFLEVREIWAKRHIIFELAKADFKKRFAGSYFGVVWMFVQPIVTIAIYYIVFTMLKAGLGTYDEHPFILWMIAGIVPWFYFSEAMNMAAQVLQEYNYLVKKVVFRVSLLPIVKIASALFIHAIFVLILMIFFMISGYAPTVYWLQMIYYSFATTVLVVGLSYFTSAVHVFFKDMGQIVNITMQFGIWVTPVMWNPALAGKYQWIFKLNPMYYIVEGYRDCLLEKTWFWQEPELTLYFWVFTLIVLLGGYTIFKRLRPHFADVL